METDSGMDRLASCYFCGVAVEAPLEEYPVVPRDLRPSVEDQSTVVLCPECRRKLSTIVDRVVTVATDPGQAELTKDANQRTLGEAEGARDVDSTQDESSVLEGFDHESPDLLDVNESEQGDTAGEDTSEEQPERDSVEDRVDPAEKADESEAAFFEREQPTGPGSTSDEERETESDEQSTPASKAQPSESGDEPESEGTEQRKFSRAAYNRVVKLLQNRAFPVETEAIVTVADSAYEIDEDDSQAILDALVDRGVIERDGNKLRRPETAQDD